MIDKFQSLFGAVNEPVVAACGDDIIYKNAAARRVHEFASAQLRDLVPELALSETADSFITETKLGGDSYLLSGTRLDDAVVYVFRRDRPHEFAQAENVISSVALALREPMSIIGIASSQVLPFVEAKGNDKLREYAKLMHRGYYGVLRALNRLDAFVYLSGGAPLSHERTRVDIVVLINELVGTLAQLLELPEGRLEFTPEAQELIVNGDKRLIERMLLCLLGNAFIFSGDDTNIRISARQKDDKVMISVSDNGGGISDDARFDVWARYGAMRELDDTKRGSGLGLSIVQAVCRSHGGGAVLESREGYGTTVVVSLAVRPDEGILPVFDSPEDYSAVAGMDEILAELANLIPKDKFTMKYMD